jgi:aminoglycoside phosphotransferase
MKARGIFIAQQTSIPVPEVCSAFARKGWTYIAMGKINGEMLGVGWAKRTADSIAKILNELNRMAREMRNIPP